MNIQGLPDNSGNAGDLTDVQSYSYILWNWIYDRLADDPFFVNFVVRRATTALPVELWAQVPFLGVYLSEDPIAAPGGIWNQGPIQFTHNVRIGFQFILRNNDSDVLLRDLDRVKWFVLRALLRDDRLTNRWNTALPGGTAFNGISSGRIRAVRFARTKDETPVGEQQIELNYQFETMWYPFNFDDLQRIDISTGFPGPGSTPEERAAIVQAKLVILFDPDPVPPPLPPDTDPPGPPPGSPP